MADHAGVRPPAGGERARVLTAAAIAALVGGTVEGDAGVSIRGVAPLDRADATHLSFLASPSYAALFSARGSLPGVVLVTPALASSVPTGVVRVVVDNPHEALLAVLPSLHPPADHVPGVHATARIGRGAVLAEGVALGPYVVIGEGARVGPGSCLDAHVVVGAGVEVGADCYLAPGVSLYSGTSLGDRVRVHAGARLGSDGFGYVFRNGAHEKIPHVGRCVVQSDVEIGANTTIDRGSIDDTVIGAGTKIDNLVHIAHNVRIGKLCLLMAQVGVAGSVRIEDGCVLAGQVGVSGHLTIGHGARLAAQAGVFGDVPAGETWSGYPARPHKEALRAQAASFRLPAMLRGLERLLARETERSE